MWLVIPADLIALTQEHFWFEFRLERGELWFHGNFEVDPDEGPTADDYYDEAAIALKKIGWCFDNPDLEHDCLTSKLRRCAPADF